MCVCVCVCVSEREREKEGNGGWGCRNILFGDTVYNCLRFRLKTWICKDSQSLYKIRELEFYSLLFLLTYIIPRSSF